MKSCKSDGCEVSQKYLSLGFCAKHYNRWRKYGTDKPDGRFRSKEKHGLAKSPEYSVWEGIIQRTTNPNNHHYNNYGGRGVGVSDEWRQSFATFIGDVGRRPSRTHTIERVDNNRGYSKENCRWATRAEQNANRRVTKIYEGKTYHQWAAICKTSYRNFCHRAKIYSAPAAVEYFSKKNGIDTKTLEGYLESKVEK